MNYAIYLRKMIFKLLRQFDYYGESEAIEIAKGKYELCTSFKKAYKQRIRAKKWQTRRK